MSEHVMTRAYARTTDPVSSDEAAATVPVSYLEEVCLRHLRWRPEGLTSKQLADATGLPLVTISPRLKPLETKGLIYRDGETRHYHSRVACDVWKVVVKQGRLF